ncbi:MAG: hypothetical protein NTW21_04965 [Verrucomicrobia bacterium]|nr:hypothetical protein [Verrucomicrobiota bacterium]
MAKLVGQPADIASSAYQYRADRKAEQNPPESWLAVMRLAGQPLNKPADTSAPAVRRVLCALLWEEIRPVKKLELSWAADAKRRPVPEELTITTLDNQGSASSWWNNLLAAQQPLKPLVSGDGNTYLYALPAATCGMVISVSGAKTAADYDVPQVRVLVADAWKKMTVEIEWGFDQTTAGKDYGGRIEIYDGRVAGLRPLAGDRRTTVAGAGAWRSAGKGAARRGMKFDLLYMGTSQWRKVQPFTSQRDDVARTIVTLWTKAGNFSFLPADLENGPILAPEYGFLVKASAPRIQANAEWMLRQRRFLADSIPGGERLWCKGLQPAHQATPDSGGLFLQWYWSEALYCASVSRWAATLGEIDPDQGTKLAAEAEADRKDFLTAA